MIVDILAKTGYRIAAGAISKGSKIKNVIAPRVSGQLANDVLELGQKKILPYRSIILPKLDVAEVGKLETLYEDDFIRKSQKIISRILGMPDELSPQIVYSSDIPQNVWARYNCALHRIELPTDFVEMKARNQFATLAHEMKHADQNLAVLRSRELAPILIRKSEENFSELNQPASGIISGPLIIRKAQDLSDFGKKVVGVLGELPEYQTQYVSKFLGPIPKSGSLSYYFSPDEAEAHIFGTLASAEYKKAAREYYSRA